MKLYMALDKTEYQLPVAVAESGAELAKIMGVTTDAVYSGALRHKKFGQNTRFIAVEIDEGGDE